MASSKLMGDDMKGLSVSDDFLFKEILLRLPIKSVIRFKSVSKTWLARLSGESFIVDHFHQHSTIEKPAHIICPFYRNNENGLKPFLISPNDSNPVELGMPDVTMAQFDEFETMDIRGSSNGLVFIKLLFNHDDKLVLWNPATREFKKIPMPIDHHLDINFVNYTFGFGKDCNNYKVVRVAEFEEDRAISLDVQLFTKNSGCWRKLGVLPKFMFKQFHAGTVFGDSMHQFIRSPISRLDKESKLQILSINLNTEEMKLNNGPDFGSESDYKNLQLSKWNDSLVAFARKDYQIEFWLKNNNTWCWTKMFVLHEQLMFEGVLRDQFLLYDFSCKKDIIFDPVTKTRTFFKDEFDSIKDEFEIRSCYNSHLPSLISRIKDEFEIRSCYNSHLPSLISPSY